ncbi:MAG: SMC-Scp complex subunit ScpB [Candidatus Helarchaeota archaeon]
MKSHSQMKAYHTRLLEAILFIAERPVSVEEIKQKLYLKEDGELEHLLTVLRNNLESRKSFIEIIEIDQGKAIEMRIKPEIKEKLNVFRTKKTMSKDLMQTLAYIALKQPLKYTDLRAVKGKKTKEHVESLEKEGFINITSSGRTKILTTTLYFASVFNIDPNHVKEKFKEEVKKRIVELIEKGKDST